MSGTEPPLTPTDPDGDGDDDAQEPQPKTAQPAPQDRALTAEMAECFVEKEVG